MAEDSKKTDNVFTFTVESTGMRFHWDDGGTQPAPYTIEWTGWDWRYVDEDAET